MQITDRTMVLADRGQYGPFTEGRNAGQTYPWVDLLDPTGGGVMRATVDTTKVSATEVEKLAIAGEVRADLELFTRDGKLKLRAVKLGAVGQLTKAA